MGVSYIWNPWHGCHKYSEGCANCYVYRRDESIGKDASLITKNATFDLPLKRGRGGAYKIVAGTTVYLCMTSDFFIEEADQWRPEIWQIIKTRSDLKFFIITKRIARFWDCIPDDWGEGYPNVCLCCTIENQQQCDIRFPLFNQIPVAKKFIASEPLLSDIDMSPYLNKSIRQVVVGGESGPHARVCDFNWVLHIRSQCLAKRVPFYFKQTGARLLKNNRLYHIPRKLQHLQAQKAKLNTSDWLEHKNDPL